jgi:hypothetical protein
VPINLNSVWSGAWNDPEAFPAVYTVRLEISEFTTILPGQKPDSDRGQV